MFKVFSVHGRTPPCENCKKRQAELGIDGDSDLTKLKLCRRCFWNLIDALEEYTNGITGRPGAETTSGS